MPTIAPERRRLPILDRDDPATRIGAIQWAGAHDLAGAAHVSTIWVWIVSDRSRPDSSEIRVCQTIVRRPRWSGVHSARTVLDRPAAKKFVFDSSVVVVAPVGRLRTVANAP